MDPLSSLSEFLAKVGCAKAGVATILLTLVVCLLLGVATPGLFIAGLAIYLVFVRPDQGAALLLSLTEDAKNVAHVVWHRINNPPTRYGRILRALGIVAALLVLSLVIAMVIESGPGRRTLALIRSGDSSGDSVPVSIPTGSLE